MTAPRGKILVIRGGAIGDFILTLPAIAALRARFPHARLEVLGYPHIVQLAQAGGLVDRVRSIEARALAGFFARNGELDETLADYFSEFDVIVSYLFDPDEIFKTNVLRCSLAQFISGPHRPNESEKIPAACVYLKPLERLAIFDANPLPRLRFAARELGGGGSWLAIHPGSGSEKKNWPEQNWLELTRRLAATTKWNLLLIGGEAEGERLRLLASSLAAGRIRLAQSLPLVELAGLMQNCAAFVGHDSGISHLAAALGLPGLILWADTNESIWRPPHEGILILKNAAGLEAMDVNGVFDVLCEMLSKKSDARE